MRIDSLQQFIKLRRELTQERDAVSRRLAQINEALGELPSPSESAVQGVTEQSSAPARSVARAGGRQAGSGAGGGTSLREHVLAVLGEGAKTKEEVLAAVQRRGYRFQTNNPLNSLGVILYGKNPKFNRVDGRFSLPGGTRAASGAGEGGGRRQMSPAARARIAEAQRKRWAATRKQGGGAAKPAAKPAGGGAGPRQISPAARRAIAEAARRRWAAAKAAGKNRL